MKKMIKNPIFTFVLGLVIATVVGVYAINASEVDYRDTKVDQALDTLYTTQNTTVANLTSQNSTLTQENTNLSSQVTSLQEQNTTLQANMLESIAMNTFGTPIYNEQYGNGDTNRTSSLSLSKGKYIVVAYNNYGWAGSTITTTSSNENWENSGTTYNNVINCTNCNKKYLSGYYNVGASTAKRSSGSDYGHVATSNSVYIVEMTKAGTVSIASTINAGHVRHVIGLMAIPINN